MGQAHVISKPKKSDLSTEYSHLSLSLPLSLSRQYRCIQPLSDGSIPPLPQLPATISCLFVFSCCVFDPQLAPIYASQSRQPILPFEPPAASALNASLSAVVSPKNSTIQDAKKLLLEVKDQTAVIAESKQQFSRALTSPSMKERFTQLWGRMVLGRAHWQRFLLAIQIMKLRGVLQCSKGRICWTWNQRNGHLLGFQSPIVIPGVNNIDFLNMAYNAQRRKLGQPELGPIEALGADLAILGEIDSGLDVDALRDVVEAVNRLLTPKISLLIITHYERLLNFVRPTFIHVMEYGKIVKTGDISIAKLLEDEGYQAISAS